MLQMSRRRRSESVTMYLKFPPRVMLKEQLSPCRVIYDSAEVSVSPAGDANETGDLRAKLAKYHAHVDVAFRGWNDAWLAAMKRRQLSPVDGGLVCPPALSLLDPRIYWAFRDRQSHTPTEHKRTSAR
jgi:hypothetical protein